MSLGLPAVLISFRIEWRQREEGKNKSKKERRQGPREARQHTELQEERTRQCRFLKSGASSSVKEWWWGCKETLAAGMIDRSLRSMCPLPASHSSRIVPSLCPLCINLNCQLSLTKTYVLFWARSKANDSLPKPAVYWHCARPGRVTPKIAIAECHQKGMHAT